MNSQQFTTEIRYNRKDKDFDIYVGSEYIGSAATYHDAEQRANEYLTDLAELDSRITALEQLVGASQ